MILFAGHFLLESKRSSGAKTVLHSQGKHILFSIAVVRQIALDIDMAWLQKCVRLCGLTDVQYALKKWHM